MPGRQMVVPSLSSELSDADLGDARLNRRLGLLADRLAERPDASFPKALDDAELEAAYRFFGNDSVSPQAVLAPHFRQSARRATEHRRVLILHDTTEFEFPGHSKREGLGRLIRPGQGFFGHFSLATTADGERVPLGLLALETVFRLDKGVPRRKRKKGDSRGESARWRRCVDEADAMIGGRAEAIHVMDREADSYAIFAALSEQKRLFVIRSFHDRIIAGDGRLQAAAKAARTMVRREVPLSPRPKIKGPKGKRHPTRRYRIAKLKFAATAIEIPSTDAPHASQPASLNLNVVYVSEAKPPHGEPPVEWFLITNLPVGTPEEIAFAVDCYRGRWTIEEFFKALKTGCQYERRQLESADSLLNALAIFSPVAWRLLLLRHLARREPKASPTAVLTPKQLEVLRAVARRPLPARPTAKDVMLAVASLGGHLKSNGDPGWLVLGRGLHDLLLLELGWRAREGAER